MENETKKIILSGIQPTGVFTLGNYLGAVRSWKKMLLLHRRPAFHDHPH